MAANTDLTLDTLAVLVQTIAHDRKLGQWFAGLAQKSAIERRNEIYATVARMKANGEDEKLFTSLCLLAREEIFDAARRTLRERGHLFGLEG